MSIVDGTTVDGPGFRTSIYFAGCLHQCPGCHNPSTWPLDAGEEMTVRQLMTRIDDNAMNVTFTGGDPIYQAEALIPLARAIKQRGLTLWLYTGYLYERLFDLPHVTDLLRYVDVVVDGPFIQSLRDTSLHFRGSSNQRIIDVAASTPAAVRLWQSSF